MKWRKTRRESMEKLKRWFNEHRTETVGFGVFLVVFIVLTGGVLYYSFVEPPRDTKSATKQETSVAVKGEKEKTEKEEKDKKEKDKKETDTAKDNKKESGTAKKDTADKDKEKNEETEKKQETTQKTEDSKTTETVAAPVVSEATEQTEQPADSGTSAPATATKPESSNTQNSQPDSAPGKETSTQETPAQPEPEPQPVWHEPVYESRWVVDQAAWDEIVSEPIYAEVSRAICNGCGADITDCIDEHGYNAMMSGNMSCGSYHVATETVQTGTNNYTIHHDEVGHWEQVLVQEGYWE